MRPEKDKSSKLGRRHFLASAFKVSVVSHALPSLVRASQGTDPALEVKPFELGEVSLAELSDAMKAGKYTARSLAEKYIERIGEIDTSGPALNSIIELNHDALAIADSLDAELQSKGPRGPLHGIPILIKDNIGTADRMMTTAGSLALVGFTPAKDSGVARRLRESGALILGKTNLSEWANFRSSHSSSDWSGRTIATVSSCATRSPPSRQSSSSAARSSGPSPTVDA